MKQFTFNHPNDFKLIFKDICGSSFEMRLKLFGKFNCPGKLSESKGEILGSSSSYKHIPICS